MVTLLLLYLFSMGTRVHSEVLRKGIKLFNTAFVSGNRTTSQASTVVAVFEVVFDGELSVGYSADQESTLYETDERGEDGKLSSYGLSRLVCPDLRMIIESHPDTHPPFLKPFPFFLTHSYLPVLLSDPSLLLNEPNILRFALDLQWSLGPKSKHIISAQQLSKCKLYLLHPDDQDHSPSKYLLDQNQQIISLAISFEESEISHPTPKYSETVFKHVISTIQKRGPSWESLGIPEHDSVHSMSLLEELSFLSTGNELSSSITETLSSTAQFAGIIKGLTKPIFSPIGNVFGNIFGNALGGSVIKPVAQLAVGGIVNTMVIGIQPSLTNNLINDITPAVTKKTAPVVIKKLPLTLSDFVVSRVSMLVDEMVTSSMSPVVGGPLTGESSVTLSVNIAKKLSHDLTLYLSKSVGHSLVSSLEHVLTHSPLMDYYCYYCYHHKLYCDYCQYSPQQLYYSVYYAGYYSSYYAPRYASDHLGVKIVQRKHVS